MEHLDRAQTEYFDIREMAVNREDSITDGEAVNFEIHLEIYFSFHQYLHLQE